MSRLNLTLKNGWIALVFQLVYIVVQFFARDIFLDNLGDEFVGIEGTLKSMLMFLNLSELGIGTAVGFSLYKPIFENNRAKINEIIGYLGYLYKKIGLFVLIAGITLILFFPLFFKETDTHLGLIVYLFFSLVVGNLLNYFFTYHMFLLEADQKSYVNIKIYQTIHIGKLIVQCFVLLYFNSIIIWISLELIAPFVGVFILRRKIKQIYPWLLFNFTTTKEVKERNRPLLKKIKQISFHKLGSFVTTGTDNIVIFALINPAAVAFVGNYQMVMGNINILVNKLFHGTNASVGNLVAENDIKNMLKIFWEMMALRFFFAGTTLLLMYIGLDDFIIIWLGEKYLLSHKILIALVIIFFIFQTRQPVDSFKQAYGLYDDIWSPVVQSIINLIFSIIFVLKYGILGVFIGTIISQFVVVMLWRPYYLFAKGFKVSTMLYWKGFIQHFIYLTFTGGVFYFIFHLFDTEMSKSIIMLIIKLTKLGIVFLLIYFIVLRLFSKGFKDLINRFYPLIKNRF
ncbi:sugar transporter [Flaviramulus aquimarinus]|uniref:Sugar transporter n=1 Tax=Flaviramulus aquimarinus TaxID=1170456 RepID=A0ABP9FCF2_9FLAO